MLNQKEILNETKDEHLPEKIKDMDITNLIIEEKENIEGPIKENESQFSYYLGFNKEHMLNICLTVFTIYRIISII